MSTTRESLLCKYQYDALDRLIANELPDAPERERFYCKSRLVTEIQGTTRYSILQHDDQLLAQQENAGDAFDTTLLATDLQRSVLRTLKTIHPQQPIAYSPYGHRPAEHGLFSLLGFNGERLDAVTGHYLLGNGYRQFNPVLMRFVSPDSLSPFGKAGLNTFAYCSGNPVDFSDPSGHFRVSKLLSWIWRKIFNTKKNVNISQHPNTFANPKPGQYDYIGIHGSSSKHIESLENGLDPRFMGTANGQVYGRGFYVTRRLSTAEVYADAASPTFFDVFVRRSKIVNKPPLDPRKYLLTDIKIAGPSDDFVIYKSRYKDVVVKSRDIRWK